MSKFANEDQPKRRTPEDSIDHSKTCSYRYRGVTCNLPASMSHGTRGEGPWFCHGHFRTDQPATNTAKHWADDLVESRIKPEDYRQPHETKSAYRERMMAKLKAATATFQSNVQKLPYDKTARIEEDAERDAIINEYSNVPF